MGIKFTVRMKKMEARLKKNVLAGVAFLDVIKPKWFKTVKIAELDMSDSGRCMIGQLFGEYSDEIGALGFSDNEGSFGGQAEVALGFYTNDSEEYPILTRLWLKEIRKRRK